MSTQPPVFVVSSGRCGSTALSMVLAHHPDVLSINELFSSLEPFPLREGILTGPEFVDFLEEPRPFTLSVMRFGFWARLPEDSPERLAGDMPVVPAISNIVLPRLTDDPAGLLAELRGELAARPSAPIADHYRALFDFLARRLGTRVTVERSGYSLRLVPRLRALFPEARFVHLYRSGPDTALSMSRNPIFKVFRVLMEKAERAGLGADGLSVEMAEMFRSGEVDVRPILEAQTPLPAFGRLWSNAVVEGLEYLADVPESRLLTLAFENLLDRPTDELTRLATYLGVEPLPEWLEKARADLDQTRRGAAQGLPPEELAALQESCTPGMRALGL
jgi:hypothetical protein